MNTAAQFQILCYDIENVKEYSNEQTMNEETNITMKNIIKKHNIIIQNIKRINVIFSIPSLIEILVYSFMMCMYIIQFLVSAF